MASDFARWKVNRLQSYQDSSKKGSIDEPIKELIVYVNSLEQYFTTSSCSGRVVVFAEGECRKVGCKWIFVSHNKIELDLLIGIADPSQGNLVVKFEPFILHVQCRSLSDAQIMHQAAVTSGFRNSGLTLGKSGKIMVAVRGSQCLEVPIASDNRLIVEPQYLQFLTTKVNQKFEENEGKIQRFFENLQKYIMHHEESNSETSLYPNSVFVPRKTLRKKIAIVQPLESSKSNNTFSSEPRDETAASSEDMFEDFMYSFL